MRRSGCFGENGEWYDASVPCEIDRGKSGGVACRPDGWAGGIWRDLFPDDCGFGRRAGHEQRFQMLATDTDKMLHDSPGADKTIETLKGADATRAKLEAALGKIASQAKAGDGGLFLQAVRVGNDVCGDRETPRRFEEAPRLAG